MTIDIDKLRELAALHAIGALDGEEAQSFSRLLSENADARREAAAFAGVTEALAKSLPPAPQPSPGLRERILRQAEQAKARAKQGAQLKRLLPTASEGFAFMKQATGPGWLPLRVPGASVKLLAFDEASAYAIVLGRLDAGARYPSHTHHFPEDLYMLSGDLHIGDETIHTGDFHHAEAGSTHGVNWSEHGCVLLAVLAKEDLLAQFAAA